MKFIIFAPLEINDCGGCVAMYNLAQSLINFGYESYVVPWEYQIQSLVETEVKINNIPVISIDSIDFENDIVIYPEIICGNPLGAKRCIRWILYYLGVHSDDFSSSWGEDDLWVYWSEEYIKKDRNIEEIIMNIFLMNKKWTPDLENKNKTDEYYIIRKGRNIYSEDNKFHSEKSILLDNICIKQNQYISFYKKGKILYSYDPHTFHVIIAALCGCISVVKPIEGVSRDDWAKQLPGYKFLPKINGSSFWPGIAYGIEEIEFAKNTIELLPDVFEKQSNESIKTVENFLRKVHSHFNL